MLYLEKKVLIVEDEMPLQKALKEKLSKENLTILTAKNGEEGLTIALEEKPDLILLDIVMPKMDGMTMLKELREHKECKNIKVFLLTNLSDEDKIASAIDKGVYDYLIKADWKIDDIVKKVKKHLNIK